MSQNGLQFLYLGNNSISILPFLNSSRYTIREFDMSNNSIFAIDDDYFANFMRLKTLILSNNKISEISRANLRGLSALTRFELSGNRIAEVTCDVFYDCVNLEMLSIGGDLTSLPCVNISNTSHALKVLDLKFNRIQKVLDTSRGQLLSQLTKLDMTRNGLLSLKNIITEMPSLETLNVAGNPNLNFSDDILVNSTKLTSISFAGTGDTYKYAFKKMPELGPLNSLFTELDLSYNSLECIDIHHISNMTHLTNLTLSHNRLTGFPNVGCSPYTTASNIDDIKFPELHIIWLDRNAIVEFPLLPEMPLNSDIRIRSNKLVHFPPERMALLDKVRYIDMSSNDATIFPDFSQLNESHLTGLSASRCKIASIPVTHIDKLSKLHRLDVSHNRIAELPDMGFASQSLVELNVGYNLLEVIEPLLLDGADIWLLQWLNIEHNNISSISENILRQMKHLRRLCLRHNVLDKMPNLAAAGAFLMDVDLSQNLISFVPHAYMDGLTELRRLNLSYNRVENFPFWRVEKMGNLYLLDLQHNEIIGLKNLNSPSMKNTLILNLMNNSILCSGEICWLRNFNRFTIIREDKLCRGQPELADLIFNDMSDSVLECTRRFHLRASGSRVIIKTVCQGKVISIIMIRRSEDRLIFVIRIFIERRKFYIETALCLLLKP